MLDFLLFLLLAVSGINGEFVNVDVKREINLSKGIIRSKTTLKVENTGNSKLNQYEIHLEHPVDYVAVKANKVAVDFTWEGTKILVPVQVKPSGTLDLVLNLVFSNQLIPLPKKVGQFDKQSLLFKGNAYFYSPYASKEMVTTVVLPNANDLLSELDGPKPFEKKGKNVLFGKYDNVAKLSSQEVRVHFYSSNSLLSASKVEKIVQVSQIGQSLNFLEYYTLHHKGAELDGFYSKFDLLLSGWKASSSNMVKSLVALLPKDAYNLIYRDDIGNVSTSAVRREEKKTVFELTPRYPLFGGWTYKWFHGFDAPLGSFVTYLGSNQYQLKLKLTGTLKDILAENLVARFVLPEGATNINVDVPFNVDSQTEKKTYTYLDTTGRPTIVLEKKNVVSEYSSPIVITYTYEPWRYFQKFITVALALFLTFVTISVISRIDFSISKDPKEILKSRLMASTESLQRFAKLSHDAHRILVEAYELYKESKDLKSYKKVEEETLKSHSEVKANFLKVSKSTSELDKAFSERASLLQVLLDERLTMTTSYHSKMIDFLSKATSGISADAKKSMMKTVETFESDLSQIEDKIKKAELKIV